MNKEFRVLARELAVDEIETVSGAVSVPNDVATTMAIGEGGSGCTTPDESWFTVYDDGGMRELQ